MGQKHAAGWYQGKCHDGTYLISSDGIIDQHVMKHPLGNGVGAFGPDIHTQTRARRDKGDKLVYIPHVVTSSNAVWDPGWYDNETLERETLLCIGVFDGNRHDAIQYGEHRQCIVLWNSCIIDPKEVCVGDNKIVDDKGNDNEMIDGKLDVAWGV